MKKETLLCSGQSMKMDSEQKKLALEILKGLVNEYISSDVHNFTITTNYIRGNINVEFLSFYGDGFIYPSVTDYKLTLPNLCAINAFVASFSNATIKTALYGWYCQGNGENLDKKYALNKINDYII